MVNVENEQFLVGNCKFLSVIWIKWKQLVSLITLLYSSTCYSLLLLFFVLEVFKFKYEILLLFSFSIFKWFYHQLSEIFYFTKISCFGRVVKLFLFCVRLFCQKRIISSKNSGYLEQPVHTTNSFQQLLPNGDDLPFPERIHLPVSHILKFFTQGFEEIKSSFYLILKICYQALNSACGYIYASCSGSFI